MNFKLFFKNISILFLFIYSNNYGQCSYSGTPLTQSGLNYTFAVNNSFPISTSFSGVNTGQYVSVNVVQGYNYTFSVNDAFSTTTTAADNENLTLFKASDNSILGTGSYSSGINGTSIIWTATISGAVKVLFSRNCTNLNVASGTITVALNSIGNTLDTNIVVPNDQWVGYVYNWLSTVTTAPPGGYPSPTTPNPITANQPFIPSNYMGYYTVTTPDIPTQTFTGDYVNFPVNSNGLPLVNVYTDQFAVRYKCHSTKTGCYMASFTGDDGVRIYVDGVKIADYWKEQGATTYPNLLLYLNGNSDIVFDYYENGGVNNNSFSLIPFDPTTNTATVTNAVLCSGSTTLLDGSAYLTNGLVNPTISYQWQVSIDGINFTDISGATSEDYSPLAIVTTTTNVVKYYRRKLNASAANASSCVYYSNVVNITTSPSIPVTPGVITGSVTQCAGNSFQTYSIAAVVNAISYNWTLPANWTITSGTGTNNITVSIASNGATGNVSVNAVNGCGISSFSYKSVTVFTPTVAGTVTPANTNVCSGSNSTNLILSGNTGSILRWESSTDNFAGGPITTIASTGSPITASNITVDTYYRAVVQNGGCNVLNTSSVKLKVVGAMTNPGGISINGVSFPVNGSTTNCASTTMTFSIASVANATSYTWTVGSGWTILSGQGTTSVSVTTGNTSQSNNISVYATNGTCPQTGSNYLYVTLINPVTPTGIANQVFCSGATVANLSATGTTIKWYAASSGGTAIASTTVLTNGTHYYASQNPSGCESISRLDVTVTINSTSTITPNKVDETCPASNNGTISPVLSGGLTNIRYIKLTQKYVNADAWQQVQEIQAFQIFTGTNVALASNGATATSSSNYNNDATSYGSQKAIDGDYTGYSFWHSNSTNINEWLKVDLQSAKNIDYLRIHNRVDCCQQRGQNMLLELFDASNNLVYSKTIDLWEGVYGAHYVDVNVLDVSWADSATTLNRTALDSGTYTLNCADALGCSVSSPIVIGAANTVPSTPIVGLITQPDCKSVTGSVVLSGLPATGTINQTGTVPANYPITATTMTIPVLAVGSYNFTVSNGSCPSPATVNVVINAATTSTWNGTTWSPLGTPTTTNLVIINGNYNTSSNGNLKACSVIINPSYTLTITLGSYVIIQNDLTVNGVLDVQDKGSLVMINDSGLVTNNGTTNIHRFTTPFKLYDYTYWSTPVVSTNIASTFLGWRTDKSYAYLPTIPDWSFATTMTPGNGFIVMTPAPTALGGNVSEVVFSGKVNNGIQNINGVIADRLYLLGNPYPSALDAESFLDYNANVLDGTLYFWTHNTAIQAANAANTTLGSGAFAFTSNDYATYNSVGGVSVGSGSTATSGGEKPSGKIASGQGFFASSNATIVGANTITFNNAMRLSSEGTILDNSQFFKTSNTKAKIANAIEKDRIWLNLTNTQGAFKQTLVGYVTDATNDYDSRFDGESFDGNDYIDFYSVNLDKNLTIQGRALPFDENDLVPLGFSSTLDGEFTINIDQVDGLLADQAVFIEDKSMNTITDLKSENYTFTTVAGTFNDRFVLRYTNKTLDTKDFTSNENKVLVSVKSKQIKVNSFAETIDKVNVYDLLGRQIYQKNNVNSNELSIADLAVNHQALVVKTTLQNGKTVSDKIIY